MVPFLLRKTGGKATSEGKYRFRIWHYINDVIFAKSQCPVKQFEILVLVVPVSCQSEQNSQRNEYFTCFFKYTNSLTIFNSMSSAPKNMILVLLEPEFYMP